MAVAVTVAACCAPSEPADPCMVASGAADESQGMDAMAMATEACPLVRLTENDPDPPLYPYLGSAHWHVPWAQEYFDQGLRFYFGFNNREAYRAFKKAARDAEDNDIACSACYWAQALVLGVDLNMPRELEPDRDAANNALRRAARQKPNGEDDKIIAALTGRYRDCPKTDDPRKCQAGRNQAYYDGMKAVVDEFGRDDPNVITLFADAAMNMTPWAYWKDGNPVSPRTTQAREYLEKALELSQYPPNEGPIHWYIHLMEQSRTPGAAGKYADRLAALAPNSGHLVHMPSHIYYRMGDMPKAIRANKEAIDADERYFATEPHLYRPDGDRYRYGYYLHNIHFVIAAAALSGDDDEHDVNRYADKLLQWLPDNASGFRADVYRSAYYLAKINFSSTADIRGFDPPSPFNQQPLATIAYDFARLMADIWDKNNSPHWLDTLDGDVARYRQHATASGKPNADCDPRLELPKPELCLAAILRDLGHARALAAKADWGAAADVANEAVDIQDKLPYDEPPLWPYPVRQTLASILIRRAIAAGNPMERALHLAAAKELLLKSLNKGKGNDPEQTPIGTYPGNGWAYYGLLEIATRDGSPPEVVKAADAELARHWFGGTGYRNLDRL
ncbi:tetratricopeptide repeat protein [Mycobacterium avium]|uniref:tetratricopeptide repeat protein n=1 Tax=Mycobacterium avium TaxID=1764 RepID=UPI000492DF23|nr:hypothetical protein [Mycobacterium avium]ANR92084.1 hypothetical protein BBJ32_12850 [Mycobacterium avium]AYJ03633.1 hypothetical protein DBO90_01480 [Mycobacterium avium]MDV3265885.1 hypothetical protein [Mycobacterium avium]UEA22324.1 hypothetical protein LK460_18725 [Mycobacterium avium subsp. avium]UGU13849.1 hypothetical protein LTQ57_03485 [Mycobacterium avium subsp. avium]